MLKQFAIEDISTPAFMERLRKAALPFGGNTRSLEATLNALGSPPLSCHSVIFEYEYVDQDYQDEFAAFYSKAFKTYSPRCVRLHFFAAKIPTGTRLDFAKYRKTYLGFIVLRPTDLQRMGRTVVRPTIADKETEFIHCTAEFKTHILGDEFSVKGMPFMQQDTQVGACAQASLWMLARYMSRRFGARDFLPAEINQLAKSHMAMGRPLPAELGLNWIQMLDALQGMGFSALSYSLQGMDSCAHHVEAAFPIDTAADDGKRREQRSVQRSAKLADITYRYIESGFPVILGTADHALVAIGHTYDAAKSVKVAIQRIPAFFVHNDNSGPYLKMPIFEDDADLLCFKEVQDIIAVLPREVTLRGEEAESMAVARIERLLNQKLPPTNTQTFFDMMAKRRPDIASALTTLEYRTFLIPSVEFQDALRKDVKAHRLDKKVGETLIKLDYPKFVWVTEVSSSSLVNHPKRHDRQCLGRVVIDSTAPAHTAGEIVLHFADVLQTTDRQNIRESKWEYVEKTTPFVHKSFS
jgi:hypothetical protein